MNKIINSAKTSISELNANYGITVQFCHQSRRCTESSLPRGISRMHYEFVLPWILFYGGELENDK